MVTPPSVVPLGVPSRMPLEERPAPDVRSSNQTAALRLEPMTPD